MDKVKFYEFLNFGFLKYIFTTPQFHHWHHCEEPEHYGKNFAVVFPFIDKIFGTYHLPGNEWPKGTGLVDAPRAFSMKLAMATKEPVFIFCNLDPEICYEIVRNGNLQCMMSKHVDDLKLAGPR